METNAHSGAYNGLGVIYAEQKKLDLAIKNWSLAIQKNRQNFEAVLNLAFAYMEINEKKKALEFRLKLTDVPQEKVGGFRLNPEHFRDESDLGDLR